MYRKLAMNRLGILIPQETNIRQVATTTINGYNNKEKAEHNIIITNP